MDKPFTIDDDEGHINARRKLSFSFDDKIQSVCNVSEFYGLYGSNT